MFPKSSAICSSWDAVKFLAILVASSSVSSIHTYQVRFLIALVRWWSWFISISGISCSLAETKLLSSIENLLNGAFWICFIRVTKLPGHNDIERLLHPGAGLDVRPKSSFERLHQLLAIDNRPHLVDVEKVLSLES